MKKNSMYWTSECAFRVENYNQVIILGNELLNYNDFGRKETIFIIMAISYDNLNNMFEARKYYRKYLTEFPNSKFSAFAKSKLSAN